MAGSHGCRQEASVLRHVSLSTGYLVAWHSSGGELGSDLERGGESKSLWTDFKPYPPSRTPPLPFLSFSLFFFFVFLWLTVATVLSGVRPSSSMIQR